ncbi:glycine oxidase ThiO [Bacillus salitolerans]|uniref:glycine oxidase n=1 Tax=Bacillus salitolerans TaxID=1437434 RepID=A0ABW4LVW4_9BACI
MKKQYDVLIVGGGIIGHSIAYTLSKRGSSVLVLEKGEINEKASQRAAGMLAAQGEVKEDGPLFQLARKSRNTFPALKDELKEQSGIDIELIEKGMLNVAMTDEKADELKEMILFQQSAGEDAIWLSAKEANELEPGLSTNIIGAMYAPKDGQVSAPKLAHAFAKAASSLGADIQEHTEVVKILSKQGKCVGVETACDTFLAEHVVVTTGAWTKQVLQSAGLTLPIYPVKGECISVHSHRSIIEKTIFTDECYVVPKCEGRFIIGATMVPNTFDEQVRVGSVTGLLNKAMNLVPFLKDTTWEKVWAGIRPQTIDGLPFMGEHPMIQGLYVSTGHYRNGILLSPITGEIMADMIHGVPNNQDITAFSLHRAIKEVEQP